MGADLLITIAVDLGPGAWFRDDWPRIAASLTLGKAGDVRQSSVPGAMLAARAAGPIRASASAAIRPASWPADPDGGYTLLAGYLHDRDELAERLGIAAPPHDAALYAAAHALWGDDCDVRMCGDYAAIRWLPDSRELRLARSAVSACPLHLWRDGDRVVCTSIPRAIFAAGVQPRIDDAHLADNLLLNQRSEARSWYVGLERVACGTFARLSPGGLSRHRFWSAGDIAPVRFARDDDYVEAVDEQFRRAVRTTLADTARPGLLLSGGFDSQTVASYAAEQLGPTARLPSFTWVPLPGWTPANRPRTFGDEAPYVRALSEMYPQIEPHFINADDLHYGDRLDQLLLLGSWPTHNEMNSAYTHATYATAAGMGCDALLCGDLGNTGFSYDGLTGYPTWFRRGQWLRLAREVAMSGDTRPYWRKLLSLAVWPHVPLALRQAVDRRRHWRPSPFVTWCPMREDFAGASGALGRVQEQGQDIDGYDYASARAWRAEVLASVTGEAPEIELAFRLLHGVSRRDPTAYRPLLELCAGIPDEQYLRDGKDRWLSRRLMRGRVPEAVRTERREGMVGADWPVRFARDRDALLKQMNAMQRDERLSQIFDFPRMIRDFTEWDGRDVPATRMLLKLDAAIGRGMAAARFVQYVEGRNVG